MFAFLFVFVGIFTFHIHVRAGVLPCQRFWLLKPEEGCPLPEATEKQIAIPYPQKDEASINTNTSKLFDIQHPRTTFTICEYVDKCEQGGWPDGSYCLNVDGDTCPHGFKSSTDNFYSYEDIDEDDDQTLDLHFCCKQNDADINIDFPIQTTKQFYLISPKSNCQKFNDFSGLLYTITFIRSDTLSFQFNTDLNGPFAVSQGQPVTYYICSYTYTPPPKIETITNDEGPTDAKGHESSKINSKEQNEMIDEESTSQQKIKSILGDYGVFIYIGLAVIVLLSIISAILIYKNFHSEDFQQRRLKCSSSSDF